MQVGPADGAGLDPKSNFTNARHRIVPFDGQQGRTELRELHRLHDNPNPHTALA
jgi:hypothetical protein